MFNNPDIPPNALIRQQPIRCGKSCTCASGHPDQMHGPYWYAAWKEEVPTSHRKRRGPKKFRTRTAYIGREKPELSETDMEERAQLRRGDSEAFARRLKGVPDNARRELVKVRCGKNGCRCTAKPKRGSDAQANWHGPYWYAVWTSKGKIRKRYLGKETAVF